MKKVGHRKGLSPLVAHGSESFELAEDPLKPLTGEDIDEVEADLAHAAFAADTTDRGSFCYVQRKALHDWLDLAVSDKGCTSCNVVYGGHGVGKSALLANWCHNRAVTMKSISIEDRDLLLLHHIGATRYSSTVRSLYLRLRNAAGKRMGWPVDMENRPMREASELQDLGSIVQYLAAAIKGFIILVIDGIDSLTLSSGSAVSLNDFIAAVLGGGRECEVGRLERNETKLVYNFWECRRRATK